MAREIEFVIVCSELTKGGIFGIIARIENKTGVKFARMTSAESGVCCLEVYGANIRHCLGSEVDAVMIAFKEAAFLSPFVTTLTISADDGSVSEVIHSEQN